MKCYLFIFSLIFSSTILAQQNKIALAIHGGAGVILKQNMTPELEKAYQDKLQEALKTGYAVLEKGGSSMDAVEQTIKVLEDSPLFNAGIGAVLTNQGRAELDASIMNGKTLEAGAAAGVTTVKNPISLARKIMERSPHVMMMGQGAEQFAKESGLEIVKNEYFIIEKSKKTLEKIKAKEQEQKKSSPSGDADPLLPNKFGTVGCVALDKSGNLAAGTSTGGMMNKRYGRVGDSPIIGAGTYANNATCAISTTGHGEYFIRAAVAHDISALMEYKQLPLEQAAQSVIEKLGKLGGTGGVIALDAQGNIAMPFNTPGMFRGYVKADGTSEILIYK